MHGKSAYEIWLSLGNDGTEADFIASLKGDEGADAFEVWKCEMELPEATIQDFLDYLCSESWGEFTNEDSVELK